MKTRSISDPVDATAKALDALLTAIEGALSKTAATAYTAAITRHGRNLLDTAGPEALAAVVASIRHGRTEKDFADARIDQGGYVTFDKAAAQDRERIILTAWKGLIQGEAA